MSVPENARTKGKLEACVKAHDLACYTLQIATNKKNFPEQFQTALTDKIVSVALDIHTLAWSANNVLVNSPEDLAERLGFQERAAVACNILLSMIEVAHRVFHLPTKRVGSLQNQSAARSRAKKWTIPIPHGETTRGRAIRSGCYAGWINTTSTYGGKKMQHPIFERNKMDLREKAALENAEASAANQQAILDYIAAMDYPEVFDTEEMEDVEE